jgi:hypothetical protein
VISGEVCHPALAAALALALPLCVRELAASATASSPVSFQIGARGTEPMRDIEIWVDGSKRAEQRFGFSDYTYLNGDVSLPAGEHSVTIVAAGWDQSEVKKSFKIDVQ